MRAAGEVHVASHLPARIETGAAVDSAGCRIRGTVVARVELVVLRRVIGTEVARAVGRSIRVVVNLCRIESESIDQTVLSEPHVFAEVSVGVCAIGPGTSISRVEEIAAEIRHRVAVRLGFIGNRLCLDGGTRPLSCLGRIALRRTNVRRGARGNGLLRRIGLRRTASLGRGLGARRGIIGGGRRRGVRQRPTVGQSSTVNTRIIRVTRIATVVGTVWSIRSDSE